MNIVSISGPLGKDAEVRSLQDGTQILSFSVADSAGRDKPTIWWACSLFDKTGKRTGALQQYLVKGMQVTVNGTVTEREWTDKEGQKRKSMDVRVNDIALQGGKRDSAPQAAPAQRQAPKQASGFDDGFGDDSIPF